MFLLSLAAPVYARFNVGCEGELRSVRENKDAQLWRVESIGIRFCDAAEQTMRGAIVGIEAPSTMIPKSTLGSLVAALLGMTIRSEMAASGTGRSPLSTERCYSEI